MRISPEAVRTPEYLRSEENGMVSRICSVGLNLAVFSSFDFKASEVAVSALELARIAFSAFSRAF